MNHIVLSVFLSTFLFAGVTQPATAETATIATASNFKATMQQLISAFEAKHPHKIQQINASSGVLYNQIIHGAPFHALLSADSRYPNLLELNGTGIAHTRFTYAQGQLVIVFSKQPQVRQLSKPLTEPSVIEQLTQHLTQGRKVALANPQTAPYGIAAKQVLTRLELWQAHRRQWVRGTNITQSYQFIASHNVAIGFAALSQLLSSGVDNGLEIAADSDINRDFDYWLVPRQWYEPIRQQAILLQLGQHNRAAKDFLTFIKTQQAHIIIRQYGYKTTTESLRAKPL